MKKLLVILLTLLMVAALPLCAMAEEASTAEETSVSEIGGADTSEVETEIEANEGPKTTFGFFPATLAETLPVMGMGMLGIFLVTCVIILAVLILSKLGGQSDEE